jgi:hypothetical protein
VVSAGTCAMRCGISSRCARTAGDAPIGQPMHNWIAAYDATAAEPIPPSPGQQARPSVTTTSVGAAASLWAPLVRGYAAAASATPTAGVPSAAHQKGQGEGIGRCDARGLMVSMLLCALAHRQTCYNGEQSDVPRASLRTPLAIDTAPT